MPMRKFVPIFLVALIFTSCTKPKIKFTVLFDRVDGLAIGSSVQNKGIKIGEVKRLDLFGKQVLADIELNTKTQVPVDSKFIIRNGILNSSTIDIEFSDNTTNVSPGDTVKGNYVQKALLDDLISDSTKRKQIESSLQKIASGVEKLVERANKDSLNNK